MPEIPYGDFVEIIDSSGQKFFLLRLGNVYSCTCPDWKSQSGPEHLRTCAHLQQHRGEQAESDRINWPNGKPFDKKVLFRKAYVYDANSRTLDPTLEPTLDVLVEVMPDLDLNVEKIDKYTVSSPVFFRNNRGAYLEIDYHRDPEKSNYRGGYRPVVMLISRITFVQEEVQQEYLSRLVNEKLISLGFKPRKN